MQHIEFLKKIASLGDQDIAKAFVNEPAHQFRHLMDDYERHRMNDGHLGNFQFIFSLSDEYAEKLTQYVSNK